MGTDKGKARKSIARNMEIDREVQRIGSDKNGDRNKNIASALRHRTLKSGLTEEKKQVLLTQAQQLESAAPKPVKKRTSGQQLMARNNGGSYAKNYFKKNSQ